MCLSESCDSGCVVTVLAFRHVNALLCHPTKSVIEFLLQYLHSVARARGMCSRFMDLINLDVRRVAVLVGWGNGLNHRY